MNEYFDLSVLCFRIRIWWMKFLLWIRGRFKTRLRATVTFAGIVLFTTTCARLYFLVYEANFDGSYSVFSHPSNEVFDVIFDSKPLKINSSSIVSSTTTINQKLKRPPPMKVGCENTRSSKEFTSDSNGVMCLTEHLDDQNECCTDSFIPTVLPPSDQIFSNELCKLPTLYCCGGCHKESGCCTEYESCVSCCMHPSFQNEIEQIHSEMNHFMYKSIHTVFEYCTSRCRISSGSIRNGNSYRGPYKYCFGKYASPIRYLPVNSDRQFLKEGEMKSLSKTNEVMNEVLDIIPWNRYSPLYYKQHPAKKKNNGMV
eukprot:gene4165-8281_t